MPETFPQGLSKIFQRRAQKLGKLMLLSKLPNKINYLCVRIDLVKFGPASKEEN